MCLSFHSDLLVYLLTLPIVSLEPAQVKPPITQVYSRRQNPPASSPPLPASSLDPINRDDLLIALCKGKWQCAHPISSFCSCNHLSSHSYSFVASLDSISLPKIFHEALSHLGLHGATIEEMDALNDNGTWDLVQLPAKKKTIGCHWVFAVKVNFDGSVARLKAQLVAKGYVQTYDMDYADIFFPIAKMSYVRLFIFLAATYN